MQQKIVTARSPIHAKVTMSGSKKITHRALFLAALADGVSEISGIHMGHQTKVFIDALRQAGIVIQLDEETQSCIIAGGNGQFPKKQATIWCADAKTIAYFMMVAAAQSQGVYYFDGEEHLRRLRIENLVHLLRLQGAQVIPNDSAFLPFTLISADTLEGGEVVITHKESRLIHTFLMIAPFARSPFNFSLLDGPNDDDLDLTCAIMAEFGVLVHRLHHHQLMVPVPQRYRAKDYLVPPDFSIAAYFFAAAAITGGEVTIPSKENTLKQSTIKILSALEKMGCQIVERHQSITVKGPQKLQGIELSLREFSDAFSIIAALAPFANKPTHLSHMGGISNKEIEYFKQMKNELSKLNVQIEAGEDWIKIFPGNMRTLGTIQSYHDYRIAMTFAVMGLKQPDIVIENAECVSKNFPDIFNTWRKLSESMNVSA